MSTTLLLVLDGWGHREAVEHNAIRAARAPNWERLWRSVPHALLSASGADVGLPAKQMGNSEVGHMNLGAGRVVYQDLSRIDCALADGSFAENVILRSAVEQSKRGALHVLGLLSPGGVHSHEDHIGALIQLAEDAGVETHLHAFLDGRDTPPRSAAASLERFGDQVASICGRYYAMDRDERWGRTQAAFEMLVAGEGVQHSGTALSALHDAYGEGLGDEFVKPTLIRPQGAAPRTIRDGDAVVFMNFRADRARQLTRAFTAPDFSGFARSRQPGLSSFVTLTRYADDIEAPCAFTPEALANTLGEHVSRLGLRQLRIAETEKYAHVTFFFSGGHEAPFAGEERVLVPSPKVATYDEQPEMSVHAVTDRLVQAIKADQYDLIVCNFANADMVGHTGVFDAAVAAVEAVDECLGRIVATLHEQHSQCLITADHGNVEEMLDVVAGQPHTAHTSAPIPLVYVGPQAAQLKAGSLSDVAPTLLALMGLPQPEEMTGRSLLSEASAARRSA